MLGSPIFGNSPGQSPVLFLRVAIVLVAECTPKPILIPTLSSACHYEGIFGSAVDFVCIH